MSTRVKNDPPAEFFKGFISNRPKLAYPDHNCGHFPSDGEFATG